MHRSHRCIGVVYGRTLAPSTGDSGALLCIPMKIGVKFEHCARSVCATPLQLPPEYALKPCAQVAAVQALAA